MVESNRGDGGDGRGKMEGKEFENLKMYQFENLSLSPNMPILQNSCESEASLHN